MDKTACDMQCRAPALLGPAAAAGSALISMRGGGGLDAGAGRGGRAPAGAAGHRGRPEPPQVAPGAVGTKEGRKCYTCSSRLGLIGCGVPCLLLLDMSLHALEGVSVAHRVCRSHLGPTLLICVIGPTATGPSSSERSLQQAISKSVFRKSLPTAEHTHT